MDVLGFELGRESPMGPNKTWIQMRSSCQAVTITLVPWFEKIKPGGLQRVMVNTDDIAAPHKLLRSRALAWRCAWRRMSRQTGALQRSRPLI